MTQNNKDTAVHDLCAAWCRDADGEIYNFDQLLERITAFHGYPAPGLIIGAKMVDVAMTALAPGGLFDAICETGNCLPDAIQMLTPCTAGNGWLKVLDLGRFALALYDKHTGDGIRVFIDPNKVASWPMIDNWFFKLKSKAEQDGPRLLDEIQHAGEQILQSRKIHLLDRMLTKQAVGHRGLCPQCLELYPLKHGPLCRACQGHSPYTEASSNPIHETTSE
jgi:formylmethanofuran dehydrogenase subunit E